MVKEFLESELKRLSIQQSELAKKAGVEKSTISRVMKSSSVTVEMAAKLVNAGVDLDGLLKAETTQKKEAILKILNS